MTRENQEALIRAYRAAIVAEQSEIADMLEDVILSEMVPSCSVTSGVTVGGTTSPFGSVSYDKGVTLLGAKMECTGIDHLSKEATA